MAKIWTTVLCFSFCITGLFCNQTAFHKALEERNHLLEKSIHKMLGSEIVLSDNEEKANKIIMDLKNKDMDYWFENPQYFNFSKHYFKYREEIKKTELFKILQKMPKGALLHVHDTTVLSPDYVVKLTYWDDLFVCFEEDTVQFMFSLKTPNNTCTTEWQLMKDARNSSGNVTKFDADLRKHFTLAIDNPEEVYTDINKIWSVFMKYFIITTPFLTYKPVWEQYFYDCLLAFRADNLMYAEVRSVLPVLYDLDGTEYDIIDTAISYKNVSDQFMIDYPDFFGAKLIYAPLRSVDNETVEEYLNTAKQLKQMFPTFFAGFDLTGQEDKGPPLRAFLSELSNASNDLNYFFHAGETDWYGTTSDENLIDAIVLNTRRIGHGYAMIKYPVLIEKIKKKGIAIEVNVVTSIVETLVHDTRNHPCGALFAQNVSVVISSDDPGVLEAEPMTDDMYIAFMGIASRHADLKILKQLVLNSLYYSEYSNKNTMLQAFNIRWTNFINNLVAGN